MIVYPSAVVKDSLLKNALGEILYICFFFFPGTASTQCLAEEIQLSNAETTKSLEEL